MFGLGVLQRKLQRDIGVDCRSSELSVDNSHWQIVPLLHMSARRSLERPDALGEQFASMFEQANLCEAFRT